MGVSISKLKREGNSGMGEEEATVVQQAQQIDTAPTVQSDRQLAQDQHPMESLLEDDYDFQALRRGQIVEGFIVQIRPDEILVDVGS